LIFPEQLTPVSGYKYHYPLEIFVEEEFSKDAGTKVTETPRNRDSLAIAPLTLIGVLPFLGVNWQYLDPVVNILRALADIVRDFGRSQMIIAPVPARVGVDALRVLTPFIVNAECFKYSNFLRHKYSLESVLTPNQAMGGAHSPQHSAGGVVSPRRGGREVRSNSGSSCRSHGDADARRATPPTERTPSGDVRLARTAATLVAPFFVVVEGLAAAITITAIGGGMAGAAQIKVVVVRQSTSEIVIRLHRGSPPGACHPSSGCPYQCSAVLHACSEYGEVSPSVACHPSRGGPYQCSAVLHACSEYGEAKSFRRVHRPPFVTHISQRAPCSYRNWTRTPPAKDASMSAGSSPVTYLDFTLAGARGDTG
jgi:hypothetical protein